MATAPVLVSIESRSMGHDAETLRFQRLERVRARRRARRRHRLFFVTTLVIALATAGVVRFTAIRRTSFERLGSASAAVPVEIVKPPAASPAATGSASPPPSAVVPAPTRAEGVKRDATLPPRIHVEADRRARSRSDSQGHGAVAPSRDAPHDAEAVDPTAAIDWLLKTSRTRSH